MKKGTENPSKKPKLTGPQKPKFNFYWIYALIAVLLIGLQIYSFQGSIEEIDYRSFEQEMLKEGHVEKMIVVNNEFVEVFIKESSLELEQFEDVAETAWGSQNQGPHFKFSIGSVDYFQEQIAKAQEATAESELATITFERRRNWFTDALGWMLPIFIIIAIWLFIMRRLSGGGGGPGGQIFNIGKSKATLFDKDTKVSVSFKDVAGLDEAKEEVMEIVDFLKYPKKYTELGGKIPKGVLLVGSPGTGKTLMAKAVAGEAQVPFFSISGSDFVEMFVGVGASRVRDLFKQAREKAPCIIFIDEIDAIGRARGKNMMQGGNDERENTLNQLLVEMDGFSGDSGVILLGATNRPDVLDSALLRPGRFDRQITIDKPDMVGREQIFKVHLKPIKLSKDVDEKKLAAQTPGFAGAEIANVCNEAALIAARRNKKQVEMKDFNDAIDRVIGGLEKKNKIISPEEKQIIAYHEAGHAICGWFFDFAHPLVKVSIVPRGMAALGYAQYLPKEQYLYTTEQLMDSICMTLGGRAAEEIIFGKISTGAQNDLERITKTVYSMITQYGMNKKIGHISFTDNSGEYNFKKPYSEETAKLIDIEARDLINIAYQRTIDLLNEKRSQLELIAKELLDKEIIFKSDIERMIGKRPMEIKAEEAEKIALNGTKKETETEEKSDGETTPKEENEDYTNSTADLKSDKKTDEEKLS
ncbi:MAG: ATP-dependent metallopeptidase FtsH/Yme1/Tma family protein [Chitinophagaceae bacterium]|nr:MAG: ATP-dependent metallopeptidase FtsH/Yme1/Tma family protein [Chitinophagaceae bacterium]